ncbi:sugar ABC transporter substrate-binding protein [Ruminococcus sp. 5_1_39BFAA]|uniref:sugar ABC transporter substrate-binding protein n=1 Tax=Ruminococcus sp. 5_1_39BFAA TaxID=457412 RepID=UPI003561F19F
MKKSILFTWIILLITGVCFPPTNSFASSKTDAPLRIGLELGESDYNTSFHILNENLKHLETLANIEIVRTDGANSGTSNEQSIYNVENLIEKNVDGILFAPTTDRLLPAICRMCEEEKIYWGIYMRSILDKDIEAFCKASPYYIGNTYENEEQGAYELAKSVLEKGYRKFALLSESRSDNTCRQREEGFQKALMEYPDAEIVAEARNMRSFSDIEENTQSIIQAYPDLDCIFLVGTKTVGGSEYLLKTIQAVRSTSRISLIAFDFSGHLTEDFQTGILKSAYGTMQLSMDPYYLAIKMINTLKGFPLEERSTSHYIEGVLITSEEQARELSPVIEDRSLLFFSDDFVENTLFKWNNPSLDEEAFQQIINDNRMLQLSESSGNVSTIVAP